MEEQKEFTCNKSLLRKELKIIRSNVENRQAKTLAILKSVLNLVSGNVLVYVSIGSEVSTNYIITELYKCQNVVVYAPYTVDGDINVRKLVSLGTPDKNGNLPLECYGEELNADKLDYCLTPALAVNRKGYRLGYGKGCYDKFFSGGYRGVKVGLAFECQLVDFLEENHDMPLDCCITEKRVVYFNYESNIG